MVKKVINTGIEGNDATGDPIREAFDKTNSNFNELYAVFGKGTGFPFTALSDYDPTRNGELIPKSLFIVNDAGDRILAKTLEGEGIEIVTTDPNKITLRNSGSKLVYDANPALGGNLNANNFAIGGVRDPIPGAQGDAAALNVSESSFATTRGYVGSTFVKLAGSTMTGALNVPAGATGTAVPQKQEVVGRAGLADNQMIDELWLFKDPTEASNPLTAATRNYVDVTAFSSQVNLYVSTNGDDFRFNIPDAKRGTAPAYSFKTINQACFKAGKIIDAAANELGPYQKPIFYGNSTGFSTIVSISNSILTITNGGYPYGTDMRGNGGVASFDIRAGHLIRGTTSGATVVVDLIGTVTGSTETYTVHYTPDSPIFIIGEELEYGEAVKKPNITIYIESGEYFENLPIRVPNNVSLCGDDLRRVIVRPRSGPSGSIWSDTYFRRDPRIDGLDVTQKDPVTHIGRTFGYHYLTDSSKNFYNNLSNLVSTISTGSFLNAHAIIHVNRTFIQDEMIAYINYKIAHSIAPYTGLVYDQDLCHRDVGSIVDALCFDLIYGGYSKSLEAAMSFFMNASALRVVNDSHHYLDDALGIQLKYILEKIVDGIEITGVNKYSITPQVRTGYATGDEAKPAIESLLIFMLDILDRHASVNFPMNNDEMDMFMLNDSNRVRTLTGQGHGGFMCVLDPAGQVLTKSPYIQQCSSFAKSINKHHFAGGVFVDAFTGNLQCTITARTYDSGTKLTTLTVTGLTHRVPQLPTSFFFQGVRFEVDYIGPPVTPLAGSYILYLNQNTPDIQSYTKSSTPLLVATTVIEIQTAGNRSMLASDFTQINDLGYGIFVTNNAFFEAVSIFCYYNYRAFYALNGALIRSLNGSCGYGTYALSAEGSDPTEVPTTANLKNPMVQILVSYSADTLSTKNKKGDLLVYVTVNPSTNYVPYNVSELEVDNGDGTFSRYEISSATATGITNVYVLSINTSGNSNTASAGLGADITDGTNVILRNLQNFEVLHLATIQPTRPSTALHFNNDENIYHVLSYSSVVEDNGVGTGDLAAVLTVSESYAYIQISPDAAAGLTSNTGQIGATKIIMTALSTAQASKIVGMVFGWGDTVHTISAYETPTQTGQTWARITFTPALTKTVAKASYDNNIPTLKAGLNGGAGADLTVQISVMRASGHDLVDIGTGSFADSNIPANIYGGPANAKQQAYEVQEIGKGRVFYATTDQDGNFRVGKFFRVDQGTGTVTFSASIALSNLSGIGFKRGVTVSEFSTDDTMSNNATDTVPVQSAVVNYINKRLGISYPGNSTTQNKLGPGFMSLDGSTPFGTEGDNDPKIQSLNMASHQIVNLAGPTQDSHAATKLYVDNGLALKLNLTGGTMSGVINMASHKITNLTTPTATGDAANYDYVNTKSNISALNDVTLVTNVDKQILYYDNSSVGYTGSNAKWRNSLLKDANVDNSAAIAQSKLDLNDATTGYVGSVGTVKGISSFSPDYFSISSGNVGIKLNGLSLDRVTQIGAGYVLGNKQTVTANVTTITFADVVNSAISGSDTGLLRRSGPSAFATISYTSSGTAGTIVQRDNSGDGGFTAGDLSVTSVTASGALGASSISASGDISGSTLTASSTVKAGNEIWLNDTKLFGFNGNITQMITQNSDIALQIGGTAGNPTGKLYGAWTLDTGATLQATYADLAEYYESDKEYTVGSVMMIGGDKEVTLAKGHGTTAVAGVISTNPAFIMNEKCSGIKIAIALQGRVPCRVIGQIRKGDLLVVSAVPGVATTSTDPKPGSIIGKALRNYNSDRVGTIEVLVGKH